MASSREGIAAEVAFKEKNQTISALVMGSKYYEKNPKWIKPTVQCTGSPPS
jgi:hypothetical protein